MPGFEGKTVPITGGASSQGASHARACLAEEANVAVTDF
jgi:NAD(P)-dependent dehydrogenase (short-subunit alcohol dehydrogenase family)